MISHDLVWTCHKGLSPWAACFPPLSDEAVCWAFLKSLLFRCDAQSWFLYKMYFVVKWNKTIETPFSNYARKFWISHEFVLIHMQFTLFVLSKHQNKMLWIYRDKIWFSSNTSHYLLTYRRYGNQGKCYIYSNVWKLFCS